MSPYILQIVQNLFVRVLVDTLITEPVDSPPRSQAVMYCLTGDRNVIHADPDIAQAMGFTAPILHGSCTLAIACKEIIAGFCEYKPERIKTFGTRFTSIVYPGEQVETKIWVDQETLSFRCRFFLNETWSFWIMATAF